MKILNRWTGALIKEVEANLCDADLCGANLCGANLCDADLRGANLCGANLRGANLCDADLNDVPIIEQIDAKILKAIETGGKLDMGSWHVCETTHCRAGWAVTIAGDPGRKLEQIVGTENAATFIYLKSRPGEKIPNFFASNETALADIKSCAEKQLAGK